MRSPTLKDIAIAAGVSKSTAQRAMAGDVRCARETRDNVQKIAQELGYRPSPIFSCMGSRNEHKRLDSVPVAYVDVVTDADKSGMSYFAFVEKRANELGYRLERFNLAERVRSESIWKTLYNQGFVGVVLGRVRERDMPLLLKNEIFPVVCCGRLDALPWHTVRSGVVEAFHWLYKKVLSFGYRKIGAAICRHRTTIEDDFCRYAALLACQEEQGESMTRIPPFLGEPHDQKGFIAWVKENRPDVVVGFHNGFYFDLLDAGYRIPEDIGFVTLHQAGPSHDARLTVCGFEQNTPVIAECAMNLLDLIVRHGEQGLPSNPQNVLIDPIWFDGDTLKHQPKRR